MHTEVVDTLIKNDLIHKIAQKSITFTENLGEFYDKYMKYSTNAANKKEISDLYNKLKLYSKKDNNKKFLVVNGKKIPFASPNDPVYKEGATIILRGKPITEKQKKEASTGILSNCELDSQSGYNNFNRRRILHLSG